MLVKNITYTNFDGETVTEPFYFNLTQAEIIQLEAYYEKYGGVRGAMNEALKTKSLAGIESVLRTIIGKAYGERPSGSKKILKSAEISDTFFSTEAYSELLFELLESSDNFDAFFNAIQPDMSSMNSRLDRLLAKAKAAQEKDKATEPDTVV